MSAGIIVAGVLGVAGVGYYMYLQQRYPPSYYKQIEDEKKELDEKNRQQQALFDQELVKKTKEDEDRRSICKANSVEDVRSIFMARDGRITNEIERFLQELSSSPEQLGTYLVNSRKQVGGCDF